MPTLVDEAASPSATELPASIAALASLHAVKLSGENLEIEIDKLVQCIQRGRNRSHGQADGSDSIGFSAALSKSGIMVCTSSIRIAGCARDSSCMALRDQWPTIRLGGDAASPPCEIRVLDSVEGQAIC